MAESPRIEELRRRVQSDPASIAFAALAEEYRRAGRFEEAIETCSAGLIRHPSYLSAHVTLGRALIEVGRLDEAREELESVLKLAPENLAAIRGLAEIHDRTGDSREQASYEQDNPVAHPAAEEMSVAEIQAASGFAPPPSLDPPKEEHASISLQPESPRPSPPAVAPPVALPVPAVRSVTVDPALAGLEEFLSAIVRARSQRPSAR